MRLIIKFLIFLHKEWEVGKHKNDHEVSPLDSKRWRDVINSRIKKAEELGLSGVLVAGIYERIHQESLNIQNQMRDEGGD